MITATGPGAGPHVKVFDGRTNAELMSFFAYVPSFDGGIFVAAGDVSGDGRADIITGTGRGSSHVKSLRLATLGERASFIAYPGVQAGVRVAAGDVNGDGRADIITGAWSGAGPHVKVYDSTTLATLDSFFAYDPSFTGGVFVAGGDVVGDRIVRYEWDLNRDGTPELATSTAGTQHTFAWDTLADLGLGPGEHVIEVWAVDVWGNSDTDTAQLTISDPASPTISGPSTVQAGQNVQLTGDSVRHAASAITPGVGEIAQCDGDSRDRHGLNLRVHETKYPPTDLSAARPST